MNLTTLEKLAIRDILLSSGTKLIQQHIPTSIRAKLLAKFGLAVFAGQIDDLKKTRLHTLVKARPLEFGCRLEIYREPNTESFHWYRLVTWDDEEINSGMYQLYPEHAEETGMAYWEKVKTAHEGKQIE